MSVRFMSEVYDPYPDTDVTNGQYLVRSVLDGEFRDVQCVLQCGVDPNYRTREVKNQSGPFI
jgi:hypothetical protein